MAVITYPVDSTTLVLNGHIFNDFAEGDILELAPVNDLTSQVNSTDGGTSITKRSDGDVHTLTVRTQKQSNDDIFMNVAVNNQEIEVFNGSLKSVFTKDGVAGVDSWTLENGSITTRPTSTTNTQDGNALHEYVVQFRTATRQI